MPLTGPLQVITVAAAAPGTSFPDRLWIWLHVAFVIFTIGHANEPEVLQTLSRSVIAELITSNKPNS